MHPALRESTPPVRAPQALLVALARPSPAAARQFAIALCPQLPEDLALPRLQQAVAAAAATGASAHLFSISLPWPDSAGAEMRVRRLAGRAGIARRNLHLPSALAADPLACAGDYEQRLRAFFRLSEAALPRFDLLLLSNHALAEARGEEPHDRLVVASFDPLGRRQAVRLTLPALLGADRSNLVTETETP